MSLHLINKYNVQGPRYTSYPTVPFWKNINLQDEEWKESIVKNLQVFNDGAISLYIHLPYCESLCTFCGCHKHITKNHRVEEPYINAVISEWEMYQTLLPSTTTVAELHLGGGTPTFFEPKELIRLMKGIYKSEEVDPTTHELSFEAHPNNTKYTHLEELYLFGFRRVSFGIQSYSPTVQQAINRIQSFEKVTEVHNMARELGYTSISHDLIYGLPKQTLEDINDTVFKTIQLLPDRISLYGYAHVPWIKGNGQRGYDENDLPQNEEKRLLYERAKVLLLKAGYEEIGMDHFALPTDELAIAVHEKTIHRNFMGYTTQKTNLMIGLGMSAISDSWFGFAQNEKTVSSYLKKIKENQLPVFRGHLLSDEELVIRKHILDLMCDFETTLHSDYQEMNKGIIARLQEMVKDNLVSIENNTISITNEGIPFVRNCCMAFDLDLIDFKPDTQLFSKTI